MKYDSVSLTAYSSGSTALNDPLMARVQDLTYSSIYPGGFEQASFFVPHKVATEPLSLKANQRVKIYYGLRVGWEGLVTNLIYDTAKGGTDVQCTGHFGAILNTRKLRKPWAETRTDDNTAVWQTSGTWAGAEKCTVDRQNRIRFTPKAVPWLNTQFAGVAITAPTGETWKRITYNYTLAEGAQQWTLQSSVPGTTVHSVASSGSGSADVALGANANQIVYLAIVSNANQTPASDGTIYAEWTDLVLYTETGAINLTEVAKDIRGYISELSAYEGLIGSCTTSLVPFLADPLPYASILSQAASYGDTSFNPWAYGVLGSDLGSDDKPVLFVEQIPLLTDYDYIVRLDSRQMANTTFEKNIDAVRNWIAVQYKSVDGRETWITPDDDATLKDTASIALYGQREDWITIDTTSSTAATTYGKLLLARRKDAQWLAPSGIAIAGHVYTKAGAVMPAAMIQAGKRLKIANFLNDLSGTGLTWLITRAEYEHATRTTTVEVGIPDTLPTFLARVLKNEGK